MRKRSSPRVIVQLLSWNQVDEVMDCLESFSCINYPNYEIILVDNGSNDNTVQAVRRKFPHVFVIANKENLGFCKANNIGFEYSLKKGFDYLLLLNTDVKALPNLIHELVKVMQSDPKIGIAGAKNLLMENPAYMWGQYGKVTWGPMLVKIIGRFEPDENINKPPKDVDWVICNGCMMSRAALEKVGGFDENFWQCNEDVDWSYRARKAGFRVVYVDTAAILHKGGSSADSERKEIFSYGYFIGRNAIIFAKKYANPFQMIKLFFTICLGLLGRVSYYTIMTVKNNMKLVLQGQKIFIYGVWDGLRGRISPERITIDNVKKRQRVFKQGITARFKRWLGV